MKLEVRKLVTYVEETFIEGGKAVSTPGASVPIGVYRGRGCGIPAPVNICRVLYL